jgi:hypothetical protein
VINKNNIEKAQIQHAKSNRLLWYIADKTNTAVTDHFDFTAVFVININFWLFGMLCRK